MKTIRVVAAVIKAKNKDGVPVVFATQRGYGECKDWWEFPGGKIEEGERPQEALVREIREELDAGIRVGDYITTVEYDYPAFHLSMDCFFCEIISGELLLKEHEAAKWLPLSNLRQVNWLPADIAVVECLETRKDEEKKMHVREYRQEDLPQMIAIWNDVVDEGIAFPQEEQLDEETGEAFFASQSYTGVVENDGQIVGLYILHPNNIGRCGHICNASYAVNSGCRGMHIGEKLVIDCLAKAKEIGFGVLQLNAVVETNIHARHLYERLGFVQLGVIPDGFRMKDGHFENICPYYRVL